jgi:ABC-2 type transport system permease protein
MESVISLPQIQQRSRFYWALSDTWELFARSVIHVLRTPDQLITGILQPVFLIILFRYVFGGAVTTGQASYADFLVPGILVVGAIQTSGVVVVSIANDMNSGVIDRFRSLPMMKSAIVGGTVLSVAVRCLASVVAMLLVGWLVGFRPHADFGAWSATIGLLLLVAYAFSWLLAVIGVMAKSVEGAQQAAGFVWPLFFLSSTFVPAHSLPGLLRAFANNQPLTHAIEAIRGLLLDQPIGNHAWLTVVWCLGIILVAVLLTGILFRRKFN